jgi:phosphomannomutase
MSKIKFGTDGWRAIIAKEYTVDNVIRVSEGAAKWMHQKGMDKVVIGYDCRFAGEMFAKAAASVFGSYGIKVILGDRFVSTPAVSLGVVKLSAGLGVVITASHNPPSYNGYKLKAAYGGPSIPKDIAEVEALVPDQPMKNPMDLEDMAAQGLLEMVNMEDIYLEHIKNHFDLDSIRKDGRKMAYDAMFGAGQNVVKELFPDAIYLHAEFNPSFLGTAPEPIDRNLRALSELIANDDSIEFGFANDGDADRIGMYDSKGVFVDSHRLLLLILKYLYEYKGMRNGKVVCSFSVTDKMQTMAEKYGLEYVTTKIGFKYIAEFMSVEEVLVGGEESGGIAVNGHIPERDGVWAGLLLMEFMTKTGKSLDELLVDLYAEVGKFDFYRDDLHLKEEQKQKIIKACQSGAVSNLGSYPIVKTETIDGFKYTLENGAWVLIRPSGTEPVLRVYCQAEDMAEVRKVLDETKKTLLSI